MNTTRQTLVAIIGDVIDHGTHIVVYRDNTYLHDTGHDGGWFAEAEAEQQAADTDAHGWVIPDMTERPIIYR